MSAPSLFRHYQIVQDAEGNNVELIRSTEQVAVLAFDNEAMEFVHCHVLLDPLKNRESFTQACNALQQSGHPLLAALVDQGEDDGNPFYITSNVDGETLRGYLQRQTEIPLWLAAMLATRSLDAAVALSERGDFVPDQPLDSFRVVQVGTSALQVMVADYRLLENPARAKARLIKSNFERQAKFLRTFLREQGAGAGPTLPDAPLSCVDFAELLGSTLSSGGPGLSSSMIDLRNALQKMVPDHLAGEIPTSQKPRALIAPLLATYQEVARGVVNLVRIQSQRLDMANPYSMRGTLTRTGRPVLVEQVPPLRLAGKLVLETNKQVQKLAKKREFSAFVPVPLLNEGEALTCMAEDVVDGIPLAEILRERGSLNVAESYVVLAGLDAALSQMEKASLRTWKLRLEDIFLLTGFGRDDPRTTRLLSTKINEWPSFTVMLRAHPTLGSMSCRGLNPASVLPPSVARKPSWQAGWMAALGKFLLGIEDIGKETARDRESVARLFEDEIVKAREGQSGSRSDLLARFARVIHHYDLVAPTPITAEEPKSKPLPISRTTTTAKRVEKAEPPPAEPSVQPAPVTKPLAPMKAAPVALPSLPGAGAVLTAGAIPDLDGDDSVGFAELLFRGPGVAGTPVGGAWGKGASEDFASGEVGGWGGAEPVDSSPWWLKASVFIGGSMVAGALLAQLSGHAIWQKHALPRVPAAASQAKGGKAS
ncbi:MAG: hypothetical protein JNM99_05515 [Verrucomicrobiaceae bacterium]|nr:hypothetical protein [Verrucomicrobiaceae bacterium]